MSKFCHACGVSLEDDAQTCYVCGAQQESTGGDRSGQPDVQPSFQQNAGQQSGLDMNNVIKSAENVAQQAGDAVKKTFSDVSFDSVKGAMSLNDIKNVGKTKNKNTIIGLSACALGVVLIILLISLLIPRPYKKPIKDMFTAIEKCDGKKLESALPDFINDMYDGKTSDSVDDYYEDLLEVMNEALEDEFGDDISISVSFVSAKKLDKSDLRHEENKIKVNYGEKVEVTGGYKVKIKATIKGDDDKDTSTGKMNVYKIDGKWCLESLDDASLF